MREDGRHPMATWPEEDGSLPTPWAAKCWKVYLNTIEDIARAIAYVEDNPVKEGRKPQHWSFVLPFTFGWFPVSISPF